MFDTERYHPMRMWAATSTRGPLLSAYLVMTRLSGLGKSMSDISADKKNMESVGIKGSPRMDDV
jgi:hypothetical protein